jgi:hypothetical protein
MPTGNTLDSHILDGSATRCGRRATACCPSGRPRQRPRRSAAGAGQRSCVRGRRSTWGWARCRSCVLSGLGPVPIGPSGQWHTEPRSGRECKSINGRNFRRPGRFRPGGDGLGDPAGDDRRELVPPLACRHGGDARCPRPHGADASVHVQTTLWPPARACGQSIWRSAFIANSGDSSCVGVEHSERMSATASATKVGEPLRSSVPIATPNSLLEVESAERSPRLASGGGSPPPAVNDTAPASLDGARHLMVRTPPAGLDREADEEAGGSAARGEVEAERRRSLRPSRLPSSRGALRSNDPGANSRARGGCRGPCCVAPYPQPSRTDSRRLGRSNSHSMLVYARRLSIWHRT